jgi:hypothetical protein
MPTCEQVLLRELVLALVLMMFFGVVEFVLVRSSFWFDVCCHQSHNSASVTFPSFLLFLSPLSVIELAFRSYSVSLA